jgi:hypothetical protein
MSLAMTPLLASEALSKDITPSSQSLGSPGASKGRVGQFKNSGFSGGKFDKYIRGNDHGRSKGCSPS